MRYQLTRAQLIGSYHEYWITIEGVKYRAVDYKGDGKIDEMFVENYEWLYNPSTKQYYLKKLKQGVKYGDSTFQKALPIARQKVKEFRNGLLGALKDAVIRLKENKLSDKVQKNNYCDGDSGEEHVITGADVTVRDYQNNGIFDEISFISNGTNIVISTAIFSGVFGCIAEDNLHKSVLIYLDEVNKMINWISPKDGDKIL